MEDKVNGERKKLSLSSGGKLTLKNSISANKSPNSIKPTQELEEALFKLR